MTIYGIYLPSSWVSHPYFKKLLEEREKKKVNNDHRKFMD